VWPSLVRLVGDLLISAEGSVRVVAVVRVAYILMAASNLTLLAFDLSSVED
jgi:hypothetical protein